jgi:putative membrane protein
MGLARPTCAASDEIGHDRGKADMNGYVAGLPAFLAYFGCGAVLLVVFGTLYSMVTPQRELTLIRAGNATATVAYLGALIGFSLPLASAAAHSVSIADFVIWAAVGAVIQLIAFGVALVTLPGLPGRITNGEMGAGLWAGGIALVVGLLNAACMTY